MSTTVGVPFRVRSAAQWTGAVLVGNGDLTIERVIIDSRAASGNALFVALPGTNTHGNNFVDEFLDEPTRCVLVEHGFFEENKAAIMRHTSAGAVAILVVQQPLQALGAIARAYLEQFNDQTVVAITGSVGKTTTKTLVANILRQMAPICASEGNYNSDIGVALSALRAQPNDRFLVFEAGTGYPGELAYISTIINPHHVIITTIGTAHIEFFGSKLAIAAEKLSLATASTNLTSLFISTHDTFPSPQLTPLQDTIRYFDVNNNIEVSSQANRLLLSLAERSVELPFIGDFHRNNIQAAIALCRTLGCSDEHIERGCVSLQPPHNRFEYIEGAVSIISDCYNASPESFAAALTYIDGINCEGNKYAVIGSMLELGTFSADCHTELIGTLQHSSIGRAWCIGAEFAHIDFNRLSAIALYAHIDEIAKELQATVEHGDLVFIKGSRAHALERLIAPLTTSVSMTAKA